MQETTGFAVGTNLLSLALMASLMKGEIVDDEDDDDEYDPAKDPKDDGLDVETTEDPDDEADEKPAAPKEPVLDHATRRKRTQLLCFSCQSRGWKHLQNL